MRVDGGGGDGGGGDGDSKIRDKSILASFDPYMLKRTFQLVTLHLQNRIISFMLFNKL